MKFRLVLGYSRTGTDSLVKALRTLGYQNIYHCFEILEHQPEDDVVWTRLWHERREGRKLISTLEFDNLLSKYQAVTDMPAILFACELLDAYPDAKVILNRRADVDAWAASWEATLGYNYDDWYQWWTHLWDAKLFWCYRILYATVEDTRLDAQGRRRPIQDAYREHYSVMEKKMDAEGREFLRWGVQDGWFPLCKWLEKDVPQVDFPRGNTVEQFFVNCSIIMRHMLGRSFRNRMMGLAVLGLGSSLVFWLKRREIMKMLRL